MTAFADLVVRACADPHVVGVILTGSQARGMATERSDHDVLVIVPAFTETWTEDVIKEPGLDVIPYLYEWLPDNTERWERWQFRGAQVLLDRTPGGQLPGFIESKATLLAEEADQTVRENLGAYINQAYRAAKSRRDGRAAEAQLDAMEAVAPFLETLFALHWRVRPYNKYLRWELENHPLGPPWDATTFPDRLVQDPVAVFGDLETLARARGYASEIDQWDETELTLLRGLPPDPVEETHATLT